MYSGTLRRIFAAYHGVEVGMYSYGCFIPESIPQGTSIGRYCSFASGVTIFNANHPFERISQHPLFYNPKLGTVTEETIARSRISIGHDVWLGKNALILPRVSHIGNGAVIGAGSVVTKDVPPYAIVAGNPARIIKYRFPPTIQEKIEESRWWDRSIEELRLRLDEFLEAAVSKHCDIVDSSRFGGASP
jgi:virginiamycin A acetyltransferase